MKVYSAWLLRGFDVQREESWALPIHWSADGGRDIGPPVYGEEVDRLALFPAAPRIAFLSYDYINYHPELMSERFSIREAHD